jgi:pimeloyl-ACP methyl ester carboxylesterase
MILSLRTLTALLVALSLALAGCATQPLEQSAAAAAHPATPPAPVVPDRVLQERLLALDPEHISDADVQQVLVYGPTPRIMLLHGGIFPVQLLMESFGRFLVQMGYPQSRVRDPGDNAWSYSPYDEAEKLAGMVAWDYERTGVRPMLIGHSQGGMQAVKVLHELAGHFDKTLRVFDPVAGSFENRTTIVDPITRKDRPVVGVKVSYASAVGAGGATFLMPNQWSMADKLQSIPDTVLEFTGFAIPIDLIGGDSHYHHNGTAKVRNIDLPVTYSHVFVPAVGSLPEEPGVRAWINDYVPGGEHDTSSLPVEAAQHVLWAADVWYSIKKHWCLEAQRLVRAERMRVPTQNAERNRIPAESAYRTNAPTESAAR